jgi:hypothetical protein
MYLPQLPHHYQVTPSSLRIRFLQIFKIEVKSTAQWPDFVFIIVAILVCYLVYATHFSVKHLMTLAGAVVAVSTVILFPITLHLKCVFFDKSSGYVLGDEDRNQQIQPNKCMCDITYRSKWHLWLETSFLILCLAVGLTIMIHTFTTL